MNWKYKDGTNQPFQNALKDGGQDTKVVSWDEAGPAGKDYPTYDWTLGYLGGANKTYYGGLNPPTNYQPGAPDANLIQLDWPDCKGVDSDKKIPLKIDLSNQNIATCKVADRNLKGELIDPSSLIQVKDSKGWVELKTCGTTGADDSVPLSMDSANASAATCKPKTPVLAQ